jgi:hypothetical protein
LGNASILRQGLYLDAFLSSSWSDGFTSQPYTLTGPFYFTSPTVYLAHQGFVAGKKSHALEWRDEDPERDRNYNFGGAVAVAAGIQTLKPDDVFSVRPRLQNVFNGSGTEYAHLVAKGTFDRDGAENAIAHDYLQFDYGNLQNPVPASLYYDARPDCWGSNQTHCATITDDTYRPSLAFKRSVWGSIGVGWDACLRPRMVDPPIALRPIDEQFASLVMPRPPITALSGSKPQEVVISPPWGTARPGDRPMLAPSPTGSPNTEKDAAASNNRGFGDSQRDGNVPERSDMSRDKVGQSMSTNSKPQNPLYSVQIGSTTMSALFSSGSLVAAFLGSSTFIPGQSTTVEGRQVFIGKEGIFVDGTLALTAPTTVTRGDGNKVAEMSTAASRVKGSLLEKNNTLAYSNISPKHRLSFWILSLVGFGVGAVLILV